MNLGMSEPGWRRVMLGAIAGADAELMSLAAMVAKEVRIDNDEGVLSRN